MNAAVLEIERDVLRIACRVSLIKVIGHRKSAEEPTGGRKNKALPGNPTQIRFFKNHSVSIDRCSKEWN
jgi:hypothetical protein